MTGPLAHPRVDSIIFIAIYFCHMTMAHTRCTTFRSIGLFQVRMIYQMFYACTVLLWKHDFIHNRADIVFAIGMVIHVLVLGMAVRRGQQVESGQGSEAVYFEVHSQRGRELQSPDPPALPYFSWTGVTVL